MVLSPIGKIVTNEWLKTPKLRSDMNLTIGNFSVMPDHIHLLLTIEENEFNTKTIYQYKSNYTKLLLGKPENRFGPQGKNLASIIRGFKAAVSSKARQFEPNFAWQPRFYDKIIRQKKNHYRVINYIRNNPKNWNRNKNRDTSRPPSP
jgi:putative transposase